MLLHEFIQFELNIEGKSLLQPNSIEKVTDGYGIGREIHPGRSEARNHPARLGARGGGRSGLAAA
jgi:hypothetical protein